MDNLLLRMDSDHVFPLLATAVVLGLGTIIVLASLVLGFLRRIKERKIAADLVIRLLDRNVPIEQVVSVLQACGSDTSGVDQIATLAAALGGIRSTPATDQKPPKVSTNY